MKKKELNPSGATPQTIARTIWFFIGLIGQLCIVFHFAPLPEVIANLTVEQITVYVTTVFAIWGEVTSWWKNNSWSISAQEADKVMWALESGELEYDRKVTQTRTDHYVGRG